MKSRIYYVYGAEYDNTTFTAHKERTYELHGPYNTYKEAFNKWRERSFATIDNCHYRFTVREEIKD